MAKTTISKRLKAQFSASLLPDCTQINQADVNDNKKIYSTKQRVYTVYTWDNRGQKRRRTFTNIIKATEFIAHTTININMKKILIYMGKHPHTMPLDTAADTPST